MSHVLTSAERRALRELSSHHEDYLRVGNFSGGIGADTLESLANLGLAERGVAKGSAREPGWRITNDGWRCMYGQTAEEIAQGDKTIVPLRVWHWPPEDTKGKR